MDYSQYKRFEFRRKFWKFLGVDIYIYNPDDNNLIGFINQRTIMLKPDVYIYTDKSMSQSVVNLKKQTIMNARPRYSITDPNSQAELGSLQFNDFKSYLVKWHIDLLDKTGNKVGYIKETSSFLAVIRRWLELISDYAGLIFMFVPQKFDIYSDPSGSNPQLVGRIVHRKNPVIVKMGLDLTEGQVSLDPKINLAICTLLCLRDMNKNA